MARGMNFEKPRLGQNTCPSSLCLFQNKAMSEVRVSVKTGSFQNW